jgi:hypothetical protein
MQQRKPARINLNATQVIRPTRQMPAPVIHPAQRQAAPRQQPGYPAPPAQSRPRPPANALPPRSQPRRKFRAWWALAIGLPLILLLSICSAATLGFGVLFLGGDILPGVQSAGVNLGGKSEAEAADVLRSQWESSGLTVTDGSRSWKVNPAMLGLALDAEATAENALEDGRAHALRAIFGTVDVAPVVLVDSAAAQSGLQELAAQVELAPVNAGVELVNGQVQGTAPRDGRSLDINAALGKLQTDASEAIADGAFELPMFSVQPAVTDSTPILAAATALLSNPLRIQAYSPVTDESEVWSVPPEQWANWITASASSDSSTGLSLTLDFAPLRDYLESQQSALPDDRYIEVDEAAAQVQQAVRQSSTNPFIRVYHHDTQHVVQSGETITSIAWDYGVPYLWVVQANGGLESVSVGQSITIPSADNFLEFPVVFNKRIEVSISEQRTRVYENGNLKWDWISSTGIQSSPTWPGVYQVILHEENAYASIWDLYMPWFMGVYRPVPGSDFTNGFHGFPTRGGWQLLWTNSLGTRVTYGCILLDSDNAKLLYDWAEEGVVVEITR